MTNDKNRFSGMYLPAAPDDVGATFVSTKVLLTYFLPVEVLFTQVVLAFLALLLFYPHHLS